MATKMATKLIAPPDQRFECRDCPARCCRVPWRVRVTDEEARRYLADPWVRERVGEEGLGLIERGVLPMREEERRLQCVFLDEDGLCSMQKRSGHGALPRTCQSFPFGFVRDEGGAVRAQLSRLCPSIRDSHGKPVQGQLQAKLQQNGEVGRMAEAMVTLGGVALSRPQYLRVAGQWEAQLARGGSPAAALARLHDWTSAFEGALHEAIEGSGGGEGSEGSGGHESLAQAPDAAVSAALARADQAAAEEAEPLAPRASPSLHARVLFASLLGSLCYPSRLRRPHRIGGPARPRMEALRSLGNKLAWMLGRGTVDMLFVARPFKLQRVRAVERFLAGEEGELVGDYLRVVLQRRKIFVEEGQHLGAALLELSLGTALISRFARCRAAAEERTRVTPEDVREGIAVAELLLLNHAAPAEQGPLLTKLRSALLTSRKSLRDVLATEA